MDIFIEKIINKKKDTKDKLYVAGIILAGILLTAIVFIVPILSVFSPALFAIILFFGYHFAKSRNIEFEYAVTNGDIDVDKIIARSKRKRVLSVLTNDIEIVANIKSDKYSDYKNITKRIEAVTSMDDDNIYFLVATYKGERTILFFQPDQRMIDSFKIKIRSKVFE